LLTNKRKSGSEKCVEVNEADSLFFKYALDAMVIVGFDGYFKQVNPAFEKILGWTPKEVIFKHFINFVHPADRERSVIMALAHRAGEQAIRFENRCQCKDGTYKYISWNSYPLAEKQIIIGIGRDVTERRKIQEKLEENKDKLKKAVEEGTNSANGVDQSYRELYETFGDAFIATDWEFNITHWNKVIEKITKVSAKDAIGKKIYEIIPEMSSIDITPYYQSLRANNPVRFIINTTSRETRRPVLFEVSSYPSIRGMIFVIVDKTEEELTRRLSAIGATAAMVGHDIRNPLQAIVNNLFVAKNEINNITTCPAVLNMLEILDEIEGNVFYINKIIADLQDYARPLKPSATIIDIKVLIEKSLETGRVPDSIKAFYHIDENATTIFTDHDLLKRILNNLSMNAIQAMPDGGKIFVTVAKDNDDTLIAVEDTGVGISDEVKPKLFTPMFTTKSRGQGFGLVVVKRLTEALGGAITFESQVGRGTKFIVRLPPLKGETIS
jgi:PAS domain S-box-containing protein